MSGVMIDGQQWERCHSCTAWVKFPQDLGHVKPNEAYPHGEHICVKCADRAIKSGDLDFEEIDPAPSWIAYEVTA